MALQASQVSMREIAEAMFRNKWLFLLCLLVGIGGGWFKASGLPRLYRTEAVLQVQDRDDSNPLVKNIGVTTPVTKRIAEVQSRAMSDEGGSLLEMVQGLNLSDYRPDAPMATVSAMRAAVSFGLRGNALTISVSRSGPKGADDAEKIANGLADRIAGLSSEVGRQATANARHLVDDLRVKYDARLTSAEKQLEAFESIKNVDLDATPSDLARSVRGLGVNQTEASALISQFQDLANRRVTNDIQLAGLRSKLEDIDRQIAAEPEYRTVEVVETRAVAETDVEKAYAKAEAELNALRNAGRSDAHPAVQQKQAEVDSWKAQVDAMKHPVVQQERRQGNDVLASLRVERSKISAQIAELESTQTHLQADLEEMGPRVRKIPEDEAERKRLQAQVAVQRGISQDLSTRSEHADLADELEATTQATQAPLLSVLTRAVVPSAPYSPNTKFILLMGGFIGAIVGLVLSFIREIADTSFHSLEDASRYLDLPVLGVIPEVVATRHRSVRTARPLG